MGGMIGQGAALTRPERVRAALKATGGGVRPNTAVFPKAGIAPLQAFFRATGSGIGVRASNRDLGSDLNDPIGRNMKVFARIFSGTR
jgi:hypothetical protein